MLQYEDHSIISIPYRDNDMRKVSRMHALAFIACIVVKAQIPNRERGSGGDRNSLGVEANGQGSSNR